jgi:DNA-binding NarL/FixJ family response regulator
VSKSGDSPGAGAARNRTVVIIEQRALLRDCLKHCLSVAIGAEVVAIGSVEEWKDVSKKYSAALLVMCIPDDAKREQFNREFQQLVGLSKDVHRIALIGPDELRTIVEALEGGAKGYIPTSMALEATVAALRFVSSGGVFFPAAIVLKAARERLEVPHAVKKGRTNGLFTPRQAAVVEALRRGKANKLIAHELKMRESTVKVHVRKIMRKLKATNRTQVAFLTNELMNGESG